MKDVFVLCSVVLMIAFTFAAVVGVVCASIDIIRSKKRYSVVASADVIPENYLHPEVDPVPDQDAAVSISDKKVIS